MCGWETARNHRYTQRIRDREDKIHTALFVELDKKVGEKPGRTDDDKWRIADVLPEETGEAVKRRSGQVVRDDEREPADVGAPVVVREQVVDVLDHSITLHALVELAEQGHGLCRAGLAHARGAGEEEVVARIGGGDSGGVEKREVPDAREYEVLEDGGGGRRRGEDKNAGGLERILARRGPKTV